MKKIVKPTIIVVVIVILALLMIVVNTINFIFPSAPPSPVLSEIQHYEISYVQKTVNQEEYKTSYNRQIIHLEQNEFTSLLKELEEARPTREQSLNDRPSHQQYYEINLQSNNLNTPTLVFIYEYGGKSYYEIPYTGIYTLNEGFFEIL